MPRVQGFLRVVRRHRPGGPVDPDYGIDEGAGIDNELPGGPELPDVDPPDPPPGVWPPLTPENPWRPVDPGWGQGIVRPPHVPGVPTPPAGGIGGRPPERPQPGPGDGGAEVAPPITLPPGTIWPPLPPGVHGKYLALVVVFGMSGGPRYRYVVVDADLRPSLPIAPTPEPK